KNELFLFGYIARYCKLLKGKFFVINDHKPILSSQPYFSRSILDYIYYRYRSRCVISYKPISGIIKAAKSLPGTNPKISLLVDIKCLDKVVTDGSAIVGFRKIGFNSNAVKPVKSIRSANPDKTIFVLYNITYKAIAETMGSRTMTKIKCGHMSVHRSMETQ